MANQDGTGTAAATNEAAVVDGQDKDTDKPTGSEAGEAAEDAGKKDKTGKTFTEAQVNQIVQDRLAREAKKAEREVAKAAKAAELKSLQDQQKWQEAAQALQGTVEELESKLVDQDALNEKLKRYEKALGSYRDELMADTPDHIKSLLGAMDVAEQLTWLSANSEVLKRKPGERLPETPNKETPTISADERRKKAFRPSM